MHPEYNDNLVTNDIGMIFLKNAPKNLCESYKGVNCIKLPSQEDASTELGGQQGLITGYGKFDDSTYSDILRYIYAPIITNERCKKSFGSWLNDGNICTSSGTCAGLKFEVT